MAYFTVDELRVASPCSVPWAGMEGDNYTRHCDSCEKNVYDLSMLTRAEANELIREKEGHLCVKYFQRSDGTILTADCPVGLRALRRQYLRTRARFIAAAIAVWGVIAGSTASCDNLLDPHRPVLGVLVDTVHHPDSISIPTPKPDTKQ